VGLDLVQPFGFVWDEAKVKRVAMDYYDHASIARHVSWDAFRATYPKNRLLLLTTKGAQDYTRFSYQPDDILMLGSESAGASEEVRAAASARLFIPMQAGTRSLNVITAGAIVLGEALRQVRNEA
jgi:tRNA (cytidine/uridine-2'-O-)-methyltransferase